MLTLFPLKLRFIIIVKEEMGQRYFIRISVRIKAYIYVKKVTERELELLFILELIFLSKNVELRLKLFLNCMCCRRLVPRWQPYLKLVSARKRIGRAGATDARRRPAATALDTLPHVADARNRTHSHASILWIRLAIFISLIPIVFFSH